MNRPCTACGDLTTNAGKCDECRREVDARRPRGSAHSRGYDSRWAALSKRARRLQPWCTDCGSVDDLTTDHSSEAWRGRAQGKAIRLADVEVVCRACNARRGKSRPMVESSGETPPLTCIKTPAGSRTGRYTPPVTGVTR